MGIVLADGVGDVISQYTGFIVTGVIVGVFQAVVIVLKTFYDKAVSHAVAAELAKRTGQVEAKVDAKTDAIQQSVTSVLEATKKQNPVLQKIEKQTNGDGLATLIIDELKSLRSVLERHDQILTKVYGLDSETR